MADITPHPAGTSFFTVLRAFLKDHERLLLGVIAALVIWVAVGKVQDIIARHDDVNLTATKATLAAQAEVNEKTAELVAQQKAAYDALAAKYQAQDDALKQADVALAQALTKQQKVDASLTLPELEARWTQLVPEAGLSITNGQASISDAGAHATVNELEKVPVLTSQLENESTVEAHTLELLTASNEQVVTLNQNVDGLKLQLVDSNAVCDARVKVEKDKARKSKRRWFIFGYVAGFTSRQAIKSYLGF